MKKNLYILISMLMFFVFVVGGVNYVPQKKQLKIVGSMGLASRNFDNYVFAPMNGVDAIYAENGKLYYVDYECNNYMKQWDFKNWGIRYWYKTPEFLEYEATHR